MSCNCNNIVSSCGCSGRGDTYLATMQQGGTFPVYLQYKDDDVVALLEQGWDLLIAFYDYKGNLITKGSTKDGRVALSDNDCYLVTVSHEESLQMVGKVGIELTLTHGDDVYHGDKIVSVVFEPRMNNNLV